MHEDFTQDQYERVAANLPTRGPWLQLVLLAGAGYAEVPFAPYVRQLIDQFASAAADATLRLEGDAMEPGYREFLIQRLEAQINATALREAAQTGDADAELLEVLRRALRSPDHFDAMVADARMERQYGF